tara:strand:- start:4756 stop:5742 length:987 start_codon:yes stop_codon:yes gene_type:complete
MATRFEAFCNNSTDLQAILSDINNYDRKRVLPPNWSTTGTSDLYQIANIGYVTQAYKDSVELTMVSDTPNSNGEANYNSSTDVLTYYLTSSSVSALNGSVFEAGQDWDTLKTTVCKEQSDRIRSYLNRPVYKRKKSEAQGASERDYDFILIRINALLAVADLIKSVDPERAAMYENQVFDSPDGEGLLDQLKRGQYVLWNEASARSISGVVTDVSVNAGSTGVIEDVKYSKTPTIDWDDVRVVITQGGTFSAKSANTTIAYKVLTRDDNGIATRETDAEYIDGGYQNLAYGISIRFSEGVYNTSDEWSIIVQGGNENYGSIKSGQVYR